MDRPTTGGRYHRTEAGLAKGDAAPIALEAAPVDTAPPLEPTPETPAAAAKAKRT